MIETYPTGSQSVCVLKCEKVTLTGTWHVDSDLVGLCSRLCVHHWGLRGVRVMVDLSITSEASACFLLM